MVTGSCILTAPHHVFTCSQTGWPLTSDMTPWDVPESSTESQNRDVIWRFLLGATRE